MIQSNHQRYHVGRGFSNNEVASSIQIRLNIGQLRHDSLFEACRRPLIDGLKSFKLLDGYAWKFRQPMRQVEAALIDF